MTDLTTQIQGIAIQTVLTKEASILRNHVSFGRMYVITELFQLDADADSMSAPWTKDPPLLDDGTPDLRILISVKIGDTVVGSCYADRDVYAVRYEGVTYR